MAPPRREHLWSRLAQVARLLPRHPQEVLDKVRGEWELRADARSPRPHYVPVHWEDALAGLASSFGRELSPWLREPAFTELEAEMKSAIESLRARAPFPLWFCTAPTLAAFAYAFCRAARPAVVVETGVGYGVTTSYILRALDLNGHGHLDSVDLPPLYAGADRFVGALVPPKLKGRWTLHRGASGRVLPRVIARLGPLDLFIHDSLHSFRTMQAEFRAVTPRLAAPSLVIADDIQDNAAFAQWIAESTPAYAAAVWRRAEGGSLFGVAGFPAGGSGSTRV